MATTPPRDDPKGDNSSTFHFSHYWLYRLACQYTVGEMRQGLRLAERELAVASITGDDIAASWWLWCAEAWKAAIPYREYADAVEAAKRPKRPKRRSARADYEQIKRDYDLVDFIGRYTRLRKSAQRYVGLCPLHPDKHPSLVVYPDDRRFYCFGCGARGDVIDFARAVGVDLLGVPHG